MKCEVWKGETGFYCASKLKLELEAVQEVHIQEVLIHIFFYVSHCDETITITGNIAILDDTGP